MTRRASQVRVNESPQASAATAQGARTLRRSPLNRCLEGSPLLNDDHDGVDPGNPGIAGQGVTQEPAGLELVELETAG